MDRSGDRVVYLDLITTAPSVREGLALARRYGPEGGRPVVAICDPLRGTTVRVGDDGA
jgi:hypothetical protein